MRPVDNALENERREKGERSQSGHGPEGLDLGLRGASLTRCFGARRPGFYQNGRMCERRRRIRGQENSQVPRLPVLGTLLRKMIRTSLVV